MNSYPVQSNSLVSHDPQAQAPNAATSNRAGLTGAPHVSALPQDTVTLSSSKPQQVTSGAALATSATPNKPAEHPSQPVNSKQKG